MSKTSTSMVVTGADRITATPRSVSGRPRQLRVDEKGVSQICAAINLGASYLNISHEIVAERAGCSTHTVKRYAHYLVKRPSLRCSVNLLRATGYDVVLGWTGRSR